MRLLILLTLLWAPAQAQTIDLGGTWSLRLDPAAPPEHVRLPGSLQEQGFGEDVTAGTKWLAGTGTRRTTYPDWFTHPMFAAYREPGNVKFPYWLQPEKHYVGPAWYEREFGIPAAWKGKRITLFLERCHWKTTVWVDGKEAGENDSLGAPHVYDISRFAVPGRHRLTVLVDNSLIVDIGENPHSISDQTQTAWNGIVGRIELRATDPVWIDEVQVFPDLKTKTAAVRITAGNATGQEQTGTVAVSVDAGHPETVPVRIEAGQSRAVETRIAMPPGAQTWDEFHPVLHRLHAELRVARYRDQTEVAFGLRDFKAEGTGFSINGRKTFLRGTLECAVFPLTGYPPTDVASWRRIMRIVKSYGLNHIRFHSWWPPEAAFTAADEAGVYLQPETHVWTAVKTPAQEQFLREESARLLRCYGNHPSFVMMAIGNESNVDHRIMRTLLEQWKQDPRRVYTGSVNNNPSILPEYDYYIGREFEKQRIRYQSGWPPTPAGSLYLARPSQTVVDFREPVGHYNKPLVAHEMVQRCSYPDLAGAGKYTGSLKASYLDIARDQLAGRGMLDQVSAFVRASGAWQVQQFKEEIEAALRTPGFGGFELLDLHDFPGQGAALVGVLDAFWDSKGYVTPDEFRRFCGPTVPLARMEKRVWSTTDEFRASIEVAHFGAGAIGRANARARILDAAGKEVYAQNLAVRALPVGNGTPLGDVRFPLGRLGAPAKYKLVVDVPEAAAANDWDFWVYPARASEPAVKTVLIARELNVELIRKVESGATVLLLPRRESVRGGLPQCFTSIYWDCPWTNGGESQTLGLLLDPNHPVFRQFPTDAHTDWQWQELLSTARPMILDAWGMKDAWPKPYRPLIQLIDDWNQNRKLGLLVEARLGKGRIAICSMDLESALDRRPVARQFRSSLLAYLQSTSFRPATAISPAQIRAVYQDGTP